MYNSILIVGQLDNHVMKNDGNKVIFFINYTRHVAVTFNITTKNLIELNFQRLR